MQLTPEAQGKNLATILAGTFQSFTEAQFAPMFLNGQTTFKRTGVSSFELTTESGTVLKCSVECLEPGA
jgi:hypothetical protein